MKRIPYTVIALSLMLVIACIVPGMAAPTATPVPTHTPEPTFTPLPPTETATPVPTSTPDKTATAVVQATETAESVLQELEDVLGDSDIDYEQGHLVWQQNRPLAVDLKGPSSDYVEIDKNLTAGDFIFKSDVTWQATGPLFCGATFRSEANLEKGKQYRFLFLRFSGLPAWTIDVFEFGRYKNSPTDFQFSDAIDQGNGATNQFILIARGEQFNMYLNQVSQGRYFDYSKQRLQGSFAFLALQDSGEGSCEFENSWIWSLDED